MGIEQILLPILGGIAKGTGEGLEQKRRERMAAEAQRDAITARHLQGNYEAMQAPEMMKFMDRYYGKEEAKAMRSIARIQHFHNLWDTRQRTQGIMDPDQMPADFMPPPPPEAADFSNANQGGIAGLISRFIPGAGMAMNALGIGGGGGQGQQAQVATQSTGAPSGPQGYQPAGGWQQAGAASQASPQIVGRMPSGRPIVHNGDGTFSSHRNMIAGFGDKFYIVPTIYGGKQVSADQAAQIARQNRLTDPDTGQPLQAFATQQEAEQAEQAQHVGLEQEMQAALGGRAPSQVGMDQRIGVPAVSAVPNTRITTSPKATTITVSGGVLEPNPKYPKVTRLADGVRRSINKDGDSSFTFSNSDKALNTPMEIAKQMVKIRNGSVNMDDPNDFSEVMKLADDVKMLGTLKDAQSQALAKNNPTVLEAEANVKRYLTTAEEEARLTARQRQEFQEGEARQAGMTAEQTELGRGRGQIGEIPLAGGGTITPQQIEIQKAAESARQTELAKTVDTVTQKSIEGKRGMLEMVDRIWQNFDPKFLGVIQGTSKALKWREITGIASGPESVMRQTMKALSNIKIQDLTGAGVTTLDAERILAELPSPQDSPDVFVAKLSNFQTLLGQAIERQQTLATQPRGDLAPTRASAAKPSSPVPVPSASTRTPPINKDKKSKFYGQPMNTRLDVPLNDPNATAAPPEVVPLPAGMFKEIPTPEEMATGNFAHKMTPEGLKALSDAAKKGDLRKGSVYEYAPQ